MLCRRRTAAPSSRRPRLVTVHRRRQARGCRRGVYGGAAVGRGAARGARAWLRGNQQSGEKARAGAALQDGSMGLGEKVPDGAALATAGGRGGEDRLQHTAAVRAVRAIGQFAEDYRQRSRTAPRRINTASNDTARTMAARIGYVEVEPSQVGLPRITNPDQPTPNHRQLTTDNWQRTTPIPPIKPISTAMALAGTSPWRSLKAPRRRQLGATGAIR